MRVEDQGLSRPDSVDETPVGGIPRAIKKGIWARGTHDAEEFGEETVIVRLRGGRLGGRYAIFRTVGKNWLIHNTKSSGEAED
jgi:bifunctional non-homologous end joining protein LigD